MFLRDARHMEDLLRHHGGLWVALDLLGDVIRVAHTVEELLGLTGQRDDLLVMRVPQVGRGSAPDVPHAEYLARQQRGGGQPLEAIRQHDRTAGLVARAKPLERADGSPLTPEEVAAVREGVDPIHIQTGLIPPGEAPGMLERWTAVRAGLEAMGAWQIPGTLAVQMPDGRTVTEIDYLLGRMPPDLHAVVNEGGYANVPPPGLSPDPTIVDEAPLGGVTGPEVVGPVGHPALSSDPTVADVPVVAGPVPNTLPPDDPTIAADPTTTGRKRK